MADGGQMDMMASASMAGEMLWGALNDGFYLGLLGTREISGFFADWNARLVAEGSSWFAVAGLALGIVMIAGLVGGAAFKAGQAAVQRRESRRADAIGQLNRAFLRLLYGLLAVAAFVGVARLLTRLAFPEGSLALHSTHTIVDAAVIAWLYAGLGQLLFAPSKPDARLIVIARPGWHAGWLFAYGAIGGVVGQTVRLADRTGMSNIGIEGWFLVGATLLTVVKLYWFIAGAGDIRRAFAGEAPGLVRRAAAAALPVFYAVSAVLIWAAGFLAASKPESAAWNFAAGTTQVILLLLPVLAIGIHAALSALIRRSETAEPPISPVGGAVLHALQTGLTGGIWLLGVHLIFELWKPIMSGGAAGEALMGIVATERVMLAVVLCWTVWSFLKHCFAALAPEVKPQVPGDEETLGATPTSRLSTFLPLVRNVVFGAAVVVTALVVLSSVGIDIGPFLAGFGILGLAVSFGSQTLIKDIVSGIFFIADDAFRLGEYIDTGRLKGTVEKITLRSVQLRHQNGPLHTIPFGQIQSVTNYSRDWSTIKFELRLDRETDPEQLRKVVKKVGLALMEHEEAGKEIILPLKLQGIQDVTENSLVVRLKYTAKPGNPTLIQREAMKLLLAAFKENGIILASNAVTVRGGDIHASGAATTRLPNPTST
ncbi:mechanosensitive ion channel family protein [Lacibacterium aquatile]|uniref:Mechanosensitive ion channel family protein n=1 Tax=Lacibacterium aquatile TaxID=1168082 RepID=A0ABW5DM59_9PROT